MAERDEQRAERSESAGSAPYVDSGPSGDALRARLDVYVVPRGSVVVLRGVSLAGPEMAAAVRDEIESAIGHDEFAVLFLGAGAVSVWGPDDDLRERVRGLLRDGLLHHVDRAEPSPVTAPGDAHPEPTGPRTTSRAELQDRARGPR